MRLRWLLLTTTLAVMVGGAPASALAATYTIFGTSDTSPASSRCFASHRLVCNSLRAFVLHAPSNSTAQLSAGTYSLTGGKLLFNRSGVVLTIEGSPHGTAIQQSTPGSRAIEIVGETVVLNDLTVTGGNLVGMSVDAKGNGADVGGGGISNNGNLILETTTVSGNSVTGATGAAAQANAPPGNGGVARGGGIDNIGTLAIHNSTIEGNTATGGAGGDGSSVGAGGAGQGGGVSNGSSGTLLIGQGTKVTGNKATGGASGSSGGRLIAAGGLGAGGGLWSEGATYVSADTFTDNLAQPGASASTASDAYGGAIYADDGALEVQESTLANNQATTPAGTASSGGGGIATNVPTTIENSTITANATTGIGGGIHAFATGESIVSSTLSANSAGAHGGNLAASKSLNLGSTIISGGGAPDGTSNCSGPVTDRGHNLESTTPSQCGLTTGDNDTIGADPTLGPLASNGGLTQTLALLPGSPAIDAGGSCTDGSGYPLTVDQRASQRGQPCDVGAFETRVTPSDVSAPSVSGTARPGQWLRCNPGTWSSPDAVTYFYTWLRNGASISRARSQSYRVSRRDARRMLSCRVTVKNDDGYAAPLNSGPMPVAP